MCGMKEPRRSCWRRLGHTTRFIEGRLLTGGAACPGGQAREAGYPLEITRRENRSLELDERLSLWYDSTVNRSVAPLQPLSQLWFTEEGSVKD